MSTSSDPALHEALKSIVAKHVDGDLTSALDDFGWREALATDPRTATAALFEAMGHDGAWCAALHDVLGQPALTAGTSAIVALPLPYADHTNDDAATGLRGLIVGSASPVDVFFPITDAHGVRIVVVPAHALSCRPIHGLDPQLSLVEVSAPATASQPALDGDDALAAWTLSVDGGRRALAHHLVGSSRRMLAIAIEHALVREQFGVVIGSFQAVRHRLADVHVAVEAASVAADAAWEADDPSLAAMLAKSLAGRAASITGRHCQQVLAGIGFTSEHSFHRFLLRSVVLDRLLGSSSELPESIGRVLIRSGRVPRLVEL